MSMTRKDFRRVSAAILQEVLRVREMYRLGDISLIEAKSSEESILNIARSTADTFALSSLYFNKNLYFHACGISVLDEGMTILLEK